MQPQRGRTLHKIEQFEVAGVLEDVEMRRLGLTATPKREGTLIPLSHPNPQLQQSL
jgi:hypothetical protein